MGIDIGKIKVKKDTKDAQVKAQQLFKKATNAITFANRLKKGGDFQTEKPTSSSTKSTSEISV